MTKTEKKKQNFRLTTNIPKKVTIAVLIIAAIFFTCVVVLNSVLYMPLFKDGINFIYSYQKQ